MKWLTDETEVAVGTEQLAKMRHQATLSAVARSPPSFAFQSFLLWFYLLGGSVSFFPFLIFKVATKLTKLFFLSKTMNQDV